MERNTFFNKYLPHLIAILLFMVICAIYFKPQYEGMALYQSDMVHYTGMNRDIREHVEEYGENPGWTGRAFGGMPSYLIDFDYSGRIIRDNTGFLYFMGQPASYIFLAMAGFYLMLLCFRLNPWVSIAGALAYGLSTYFFIIIDVGHITKMVALAFAPPMVGGIYLAYRGRIWTGVAIAGFFASLEIAANHLQITYYFLFIIIALVINEFIRSYKENSLSKFGKTSVILLIAGILAVGSNINQLWYINDYSKDSIRGETVLAEPGTDTGSRLDFEYATQWSYGKIETFNLFIPNFTGGSSGGGFSEDGPVAQSLIPYGMKNIAPNLPGYWGEQPVTSGPVYIGAVVIFLFIFSMFLLCGRKKWWLFAVTVLAILLAWGHNFTWFTRLFFDYLPFFNKFRTISMILIIAEWTMPLLAILSIQKLWTRGVDKERFVRALKYSSLIAGGIALFFLLFGGNLFDFSARTDTRFPADIISAMKTERASMLKADSIRSMIFVLLTASALWFFYFGKIKKTVFITLLSIFIIIDLGGVDRRYLNYDSFIPKQQATTMTPTSVDLAILQDKELGFRVMNFTVSPFMDASTSYFHRSVGGYHAAKLGRYQDLIENQLYNNNRAVYNMLNTKYFIGENEAGELSYQLNRDALGPAWFIEDIEYVETPREEMDGLTNFDPSITAIVSNDFKELADGADLNYDSTDYIVLTEYRPNYLTYKYGSTDARIAVFSEIYYPKGWTAYIDGTEYPHFRVNYILRAMKLPAGEHIVEFIYSPPKYKTLKSITFISSILLLAGLATIIFMHFICKPKNLE